MPAVDVESAIQISRDRVWAAMLDIESFPDYMDNVLAAKILTLDDGTHRVSEWSAMLKGSILEWVEDERIDVNRHIIEFDQVDGDLDIFRGTWSVHEDGDLSVVRLQAEFEIGIPLLADMLNPVAARALRDNQEQMLRSLEERVLSG
jgi:ribosome-associated toxin RatA of RatAB toxin-antitoxin module